ncbi:class I SAM-dependent methyltransferase [Chlorobium phaeobacteroides]|uniref:Methyltransferase type 11 n=1 Tax=Chlorobium phaeobacteroides (strain DSM 266 / SMG 266 / 2430) TaxID=290317 RepID=A1BG42_CHLPD|nr:class I SAM-dependent methyltransferase [Chlorobium phaeobacteroides]ABL65369.1 Methyltransferase type 11 [Chlorobium phaeobacteroides DSM 266]
MLRETTGKRSTSLHYPQMNKDNHGIAGNSDQKQWFEEWFNHPFYLEVYRHRNSEEAQSCIRTILSLTGLDKKKPENIRILDIACGAGRHAIELARSGFMVTGNDLSPFLLEEAKNEAETSCLKLNFSCSDMRHIPASASFDMVIQLFTSFGYFSTIDDDRLVVHNAFGALLNGGWYVLDLINPVHLCKTLVQESHRTSGALSVHETRELEGRHIKKTITITSKEQEAITFTESVRLYQREQILAMLEGEGFAVSDIVGGYEGEPFDENESGRMILFARKP